MEIQKIQTYFSKPEKVLLGACVATASKTGLSILAIRIMILVLTIFYIPIGLLLYLGLFLGLVLNKGKTLTFALFGTLIGIPLSYYFQPEVVQNWRGGSGVFGYLKNFLSMVEEYDRLVGNGWALVQNMLLAIVVTTLIGGAIGYYLDKKNKTNPS
ncbi:hypothetical protein [Algoriphagus winogradskyi]|uniref:Phage shock protein C (PspC) family protein n=1 Tax=Algoriphagus winogradskyi TaxID=237017 RepID=A0ABY1P4D4_9BACT|nr:hypothetical protein [Algoriphagus winogradskyi]SMP25220.1 hypothetical protein SAMN06265367_104152 [Algoriphagus winogradskyi]